MRDNWPEVLITLGVLVGSALLLWWMFEIASNIGRAVRW